MGIFGLRRLQRKCPPADMGLMSSFSEALGKREEGGRVITEVRGERLMLRDGLMEKASMTSITHAHREKRYLKWMTACRKCASRSARVCQQLT